MEAVTRSFLRRDEKVWIRIIGEENTLRRRDAIGFLLVSQEVQFVSRCVAPVGDGLQFGATRDRDAAASAARQPQAWIRGLARECPPLD